MKWNEVSDSLPIAYKSGDWDGLASDLVLAETITGKKFIGQFYKGILDGQEFEDWYQVDEVNGSDGYINGVSRWAYIPD